MTGELDVSTARAGDCAVVSIGGEIDPGTAGELGEAALTAMREISPSLVLDLSGVTFMDSTGLKVLLAVHHRAQLAGGRLVIAGATRPVQRVVAITGLDKTLEVCDDVESAVSALTGEAPDRPAPD